MIRRLFGQIMWLLNYEAGFLPVMNRRARRCRGVR